MVEFHSNMLVSKLSLRANMVCVLLYTFCICTVFVEALPDQGIWDFSINQVSSLS